jgi:hypothetical protein
MPPKYVDEDGTVQGLIRSVNVASGDSSLVVPPSQAFMVLGNLLAKTHPPIQSSTSYSEDAFSTDSFSTLSPIGASVHSVQPVRRHQSILFMFQ